MISKKKAFIGAMILVITTTFTAMATQLVLGQKVIINTKDYNELVKYEKMFSLKKAIEQDYYLEPNQDQLTEGAIKGMFQGLDDPYSSYMNKDEFTKLMEETEGSFGGIGVYVEPGEDNLITVVAPIEDTPGAKAGITSGDKIIKVDGEEFTADKMDFAIKKMKGQPGTKVTLTIYRKGLDLPFDLEIKREEIRVKTVKYEKKQDDIGYIRITTFDQKTANDFRLALQDLQKQGVKGLIIDLRNNPGGLLDQCQEIADEILGESTIVYTRDRLGNEEYLKSDEAHKIEMPLVLLVNGWSASASEILSGAVRDNKAGTLVGTTTYGKGLVQRLYPLRDGSGFKITIAQYFTPSGEYINKKGIVPDIQIEDPEQQLQKAIDIVKEKISN